MQTLLLVVADVNWEHLGYLSGSLVIPFIIGYVLTKRWYWALLVAVIWVVFQASKTPQQVVRRQTTPDPRK